MSSSRELRQLPAFRVALTVLAALSALLVPRVLSAAAPAGAAPARLQGPGSMDLEEWVERLEADRLLLAELRKEVPAVRAEAEAYIARLNQLAARSDPVRLAPLARKLADAAPALLDWIDKEFDTPEERVVDYYIGGAQAFYVALQEFENAALLTVINRLEVLAGWMEALEAQAAAGPAP